MISNGGIDAYNNLAKARDMAKKLAGMKSMDGKMQLDTQVHYKKERIGQKLVERKTCTGSETIDRSKHWRLDWNERAQRAEMDWFFKVGVGKKEYYKGSIVIDGMTKEQYIEILKHWAK